MSDSRKSKRELLEEIAELRRQLRHAQLQSAPAGPLESYDDELSALLDILSHRSDPESVLDSISTHIAVLDRDGTIMAVNKAWTDFALANGAADTSRVSPGVNYLTICKAGRPNRESESAIAGIREVLEGRRDHFEMVYRCDSPTERRRFQMQVTPLEGGDGVVVAHVNITGIQASLHRLTTSERQFQGLWEISADALILTDHQGRIRSVNPRFTERFGYDPEAVMGTAFADLFTAESRSHIEDALSAAFRKPDMPRSFETHIRCADGSMRTVESRFGFVSHEGRHRLMLSSLRDITDRRRAAERLQRNEGLYRLLTETVSDLITILTHDGHIRFANRSVERVSGRRSNALHELQLVDLAHPADREKLSAAIAAMAERRDGEPVTWRMSSRDGGWVPVETRFRMLPDPAETGDILCLSRDISLHQVLESSLRRQENRFRQVSMLTTDFAFGLTLDGDGRIEFQWCSGAGLERLGYTVADLKRGRDVLALLPPEDRPRLRALLQGLRAGDAPTTEFRVRTRDGDLRWVKLYSQVEPDGRPEGGLGLIGALRDIHDQRDAESRQRAGEERFRSAFESAPVGMAILDMNGRFIQANRALCRMLHEEERALLMRELVDVVHPADQVKAVIQFQDFLGGATDTVHLEIRFSTGTGATVWGDVGLSLLHDPEGTPLHVILQVQNTTERKEAQVALQESRRFVRGIADTAPVIMYVYDFVLGRFTYANRKIGDILGYRTGDILAMNRDAFINLAFPGDRERLRRQMERVLQARDGEIHGMDYRIKTVSGDWCWLRGRETVFERLPSGEVKAVLGVAEDITRQQAADDALAESEARHSAILAAVPDLVFLLDRDGQILEFKAPDRSDLAVDPEMVVGSYLHQSFPPDTADAVAAAIHRALDSGEMQTIRYRLQVKKGDQQYEARIVGCESRSEVVAFVRNITEQESMLRQVLQAQRLEMVGQLAGGVAHDFNNLLTVVLSYAELGLCQLPADHVVSGYLREIEHVGQSSVNLTRQLLAFSRREITAPEYCRINEQLDNMRRLLRRLLPDNVELVLITRADPDGVVVDPGQFEQVMVNLVINARDAMPGGGVVTITADTVELGESDADRMGGLEGGRHIQITVADTGTGMEAETVERIFEPFFTTKGPEKGTGLGLSTCRGIIHRHHGYIGVTSTPGNGSTFRILLPDAVQTPLEPRVMVTPNPAAVRGRERILLVENAPQIRFTMQTVLLELGYDVAVAADGQEALERLRRATETPFDLVVTDLVMPRMGGRELARHMSAEQPRLRFLFTSGFPGEAPRDGHDPAFLAKPFSPQVLAARLREVLATDPENTTTPRSAGGRNGAGNADGPSPASSGAADAAGHNGTVGD